MTKPPITGPTYTEPDPEGPIEVDGQRICSVSYDSVDQVPAPGMPQLVAYGLGYLLRTPVPEQKWLITGLVPAGVPMVMASKGGLGKSFIALQMAYALAAGVPFLDFPAPAAPMGAIYLSVEDDRVVVQRRAQSIAAWHRQGPDWTQEREDTAARNLTVLTPNWRAQGCTSYLPELLESLKVYLALYKHRGIPVGLIVVDTLARVSDGDENTVQALRPVLNACNELVEASGATVLVLHHVGKGQDGARGARKDKPTLADRLSSEWVRGSSAIVDNFRGVVQLTALRDDEAELAGLDPDLARDSRLVVMACSKLNYGQRADWRLLEQDEHGRWFPIHGAAEALAAIRGAKAVASLNQQQALLVDLYQATRHGQVADRDALAVKHCTGAKDPKHALRHMVAKLRKADLIQKGDPLQPTTKGLEMALSLIRKKGGDA